MYSIKFHSITYLVNYNKEKGHIDRSVSTTVTVTFSVLNLNYLLIYSNISSAA